eukprot:m.223052 g.223052  ORF g.223052 m.223052 type:complete len:180 (+) comp16167_c0_seq1:352-891(+)
MLSVRTAVARKLWYNPWESWLSRIWNNYDESRVKMVGADRAAAEWAVKNGGQVFAEGLKDWLSDYNGLPDFVRVLSIDARDGDLTDDGLRYVPGLKHLHTLLLRNCKSITDVGLKTISTGAPKLKLLNVSGTSVTEKGVQYLSSLPSLQELHLVDTPAARADLTTLKALVPRCPKIVVE